MDIPGPSKQICQGSVENELVTPALVFEKYWPWILGGFGIGVGTWRICEEIGVGSKVSRFWGSSAFRSGLGLTQ